MLAELCALVGSGEGCKTERARLGLARLDKRREADKKVKYGHT
jgi:hypothetical protein